MTNISTPTIHTKEEFEEMIQKASYDLDIIQIKNITGENPLLYIGYNLFDHYNIIQRFNIPKENLCNFLNEIESSYHPTNPYHNNQHAADVTWNLHYFLTKSGLNTILTTLEIFACIFSAIIHDCDHPGYNNNFLINTSNDIAIQHNDNSPLENHHCSTGFKISLKKQNNLFINMTKEEYIKFRCLVIYFVIGTDFGRNAEIVKIAEKKFNQNIWSADDNEHRKLITLLCLKCADIGHVSKNFNLHKIWTFRITEEFFRQGDKEKELGMNISIGMDRNSVNVPSSQTFFIGQIVIPMLSLFVTLFPSCEERLIQSKKNLKFWKDGGIV